jgi:signal transduction histidine kinase
MADIKILVVEDEAIVAEDIASRLERYVVVDIVASGEAAIAVAANHALDLVLMDIVLQGEIDGVEAARQIRSQYQIPVIYLTANADESTLQRAKTTESFGYILKPFKEKELQATIEIALSRHQAELKMQQALAFSESLRREEQQLTDLKSQFTAMVSHEFRTPLAVIKIATEILQHYTGQLSEEKKQLHFQRIHTAISSMNHLLEEVLLFEQAEQGRLPCQFVDLDMVDFCQDLVESFQWSTTSQCRLEFVNQNGEARAFLDEKLIRHLLNNLLSNAIKYSPQGGLVSLMLSCRDQQLCIQVHDQGIGIPVEHQEHLFEPFQRATNVGRIPGTGLGLAIAKQAVDLQGGQISVESAVGQGTTFTVLFPRHSYPQKA